MILGATVLSVVLLVVAVLAYAFYANYAAERAATRFCDSIQIGSDVNSVIARAGLPAHRHRRNVTGDKEEHDFEFQGWVFNAGVCSVGIVNGKVTTVRVEMRGD